MGEAPDLVFGGAEQLDIGTLQLHHHCARSSCQRSTEAAVDLEGHFMEGAL